MSHTDPHSGLGCNVCNIQSCRICGIDGYPPCGAATTSQIVSTTEAVTTTTAEAADCSCHPSAQPDERCLDPHTDPHTGLGCNVCNVQICRICDIEEFPCCPQATTTPQEVTEPDMEGGTPPTPSATTTATTTPHIIGQFLKLIITV